MTINGIPTSDKNIIAIYNLLLNATLENPIRTSYLKAATGLNERTIRDRINRLVFDYGIPAGTTRTHNAGYFIAKTEEKLKAIYFPILAQGKEELRRVNKLKENFTNWNKEEQ